MVTSVDAKVTLKIKHKRLILCNPVTVTSGAKLNTIKQATKLKCLPEGNSVSVYGTAEVSVDYAVHILESTGGSSEDTVHDPR